MLLHFHFLSIYGKTRSKCGPTKFCWLKLQPNVCQRNRHFFWSNGQTSILVGCCTSLFLWLSFDSEQKWCTPNLNSQDLPRTFHHQILFNPDFCWFHIPWQVNRHMSFSYFIISHHMGLSENRVYSQWNSHLIGIMIRQTIGFRGLAYFQTHPYGLNFLPNFLNFPIPSGNQTWLAGKSQMNFPARSLRSASLAISHGQPCLMTPLRIFHPIGKYQSNLVTRPGNVKIAIENGYL